MFQAATTGVGRATPPLCEIQRQAVCSTSSPNVVAGLEKETDPSRLDLPLANDSLKDSNYSEETNYGPWMIVSRRRGHARGRGASSRATHATPDVAAVSGDGSNGSHPVRVRSTRGGTRGSGRGGGLRASRSDRSNPTFSDGSPPVAGPDVSPLSKAFKLPMHSPRNIILILPL